MRDNILCLWRGDIPLHRTFWVYSIFYGSLIHALASIVALAVLASDGPVALALAAYLSPLPYTILAVVGVWRSAANYKGAPHWPQLAKLGIVLWAIIGTVA